MLDHRQIVRDEQISQAHFGLQIFEQVDDLRLNRHIKGRHRFVTHDQFGRHGQSTGNADALALAARKLVRKAPHVAGVQAHGFQQIDHAGLVFSGRLGELVDGQRFTNDGFDRHARVERGEGVLKNDLHVTPHFAQRLRVHGGDVLAIESHLAIAGLDQAQDATARGGLAATGLAHHAQGFPGSNAEADAVHGMHSVNFTAEQPPLDREVFGQALDLQKFGRLVGRLADRIGCVRSVGQRSGV